MSPRLEALARPLPRSGEIPRPEPEKTALSDATRSRNPAAVEPTYPNVAAGGAAEATASTHVPAAGSVVTHGRQFAEPAAF